MTFEGFIEEWENPENYIVARTSGSTGEPKEIKLSKDFVAKSAGRTNSFFKIDKSSRLHSCVSPDYIGGKMMGVRARIAEAILTWETPSNEPLKSLSQLENLDLVAVVPSQMVYILKNLNSLPKIRNIIIGGSAIHPDLRNKIASAGLNAYETYGMTETASHIALRRIDGSDSPFKTLSGIKVSTDNDRCLMIKYDSGEVIHTRDIADIVSENEFFIIGRKDDMIISGGKKISPVELERKMDQIIRNPFCVTGFPDEKWGQKIVLIIEKPELPDSDLKKLLREVLESWEMPKEILHVRSLPRLPNGKIKRPKDYSALSSSAPYMRPSCEEQNKRR